MIFCFATVIMKIIQDSKIGSKEKDFFFFLQSSYEDLLKRIRRHYKITINSEK